MRVGVNVTGSMVTLSVWDSGPGVTPEQRERMFEPFAAAHGTTGVGLGLTICREIADSMSAAIVLENRMADGRVIGLDVLVVFPKEYAGEGSD